MIGIHFVFMDAFVTTVVGLATEYYLCFFATPRNRPMNNETLTMPQQDSHAKVLHYILVLSQKEKQKAKQKHTKNEEWTEQKRKEKRRKGTQKNFKT